MHTALSIRNSTDFDCRQKWKEFLIHVCFYMYCMLCFFRIHLKQYLRGSGCLYKDCYVEHKQWIFDNLSI